MTSYRAYLMNAAGKIVRAQDIEADSEEDAAVQARALCAPDAPNVELWRAHHRLGAYRGDFSQTGT